jgi:hypothetical protein
LVSSGVFVAGRLPERLLFPRNLIQTYLEGGYLQTSEKHDSKNTL